MDGPGPIENLPNEVLSIILSQLGTRDLLDILRVSRRFNSCTASVLYVRLRSALALPDVGMILECYHESTRLTTPSFGSDYSGTTGDPAAALAGEDDGSSSDAPRGDPRKWHSWFRPRMLDLDPSPPTASTTDVPFTEVILPEGEDDIYLLARTIVKRDPPKGLCPSHITIHEGHIRVSREWLAKASEPEKSSDSGDATVLWTGSRKDLGLRFRVTPAPAAEMPVLVGADDKPTVIYKLAYLGLAVRSALFLLAFDRSSIESKPSPYALVPVFIT